MYCPRCSGATLVLKNLAYRDQRIDQVRRKRRCRVCGQLFLTTEQVTQILKSGGGYENLNIKEGNRQKN
ncbi:hypothetical protein [Desulfopila aestuarii]|uniref:Transcriptional repressor NrdR n=1 Tax=Desulfopila aestuarii DSM 18488 TaxID=1121416 RepID=A0A1M7YFS1_9BACT|nr:hypothetical protein [Desulfopila aestuarii]SHO51409.1 hypothetical protein SAMN02745220_03991 [Desulfopila aestuarii DSM 18488]